MARPARLHFSDEDADGQLVRTLSMAVVHAADLGEAVVAAARVGRPDRGRWSLAWQQAATAAAEAAGDRVSARSAHPRASAYHRQSRYHLRSDPADPRLRGRTSSAGAVSAGPR